MDDRELRNVFGQFATGVCVITAQGEDVPCFGMTVNSFSSLSLDPPLVMWSIGNNSDCFERFENVTAYVVNILREDQEEFSARYSRKNEHDLVEGHWEPGIGGQPVLREPLARLECRIEERIVGGDHTILIGRVEHAWQSEGEPLLFFGGRYGRVVQA